MKKLIFQDLTPFSFRGEEGLLPGVAAQEDVVEAAGDVKAGFAGHKDSVAKGRPLCN